MALPKTECSANDAGSATNAEGAEAPKVARWAEKPAHQHYLSPKVTCGSFNTGTHLKKTTKSQPWTGHTRTKSWSF